MCCKINIFVIFVVRNSLDSYESSSEESYESSQEESEEDSEDGDSEYWSSGDESEYSDEYSDEEDDGVSRPSKSAADIAERQHSEDIEHIISKEKFKEVADRFYSSISERQSYLESHMKSLGQRLLFLFEQPDVPGDPTYKNLKSRN